MSPLLSFSEQRFAKNGIVKAEPTSIVSHNLKDELFLDINQRFQKWRSEYGTVEYTYVYQDEKYGTVQFLMKNGVRKRVIKETVIGKLIVNKKAEDSDVQALLNAAFKQLIKNLKKSKNTTLLSIAVNDLYFKNIGVNLSEIGFKKIDKQIYFILKDKKEDAVLQHAENWNIGRADIDTW